MLKGSSHSGIYKSFEALNRMGPLKQIMSMLPLGDAIRTMPTISPAPRCSAIG